MHADIHSSLALQKQSKYSYQDQINDIRAELSKTQNSTPPLISLQQLRASYDQLEKIITHGVSNITDCDELIHQCSQLQTDIINASATINAKSTNDLLAKLQMWKCFRSDLGTPDIEIMTDEALIFSVLEDLEVMVRT